MMILIQALSQMKVPVQLMIMLVQDVYTEKYHQNLNNPLVSVPMNTPTRIRDYNEASPPVKPRPSNQNQNANHLNIVCKGVPVPPPF